MPIAAVPKYLQKNDPEFYLSAPPGHRFLLYFAAWGENREIGQVDWRMKDRVPKIDRKTKQQKISNKGSEWEELQNDQFACTIAACRTPPYDEEKPRTRRPKADPGLKPWIPMMESLLERQVTAAKQLTGYALFSIEAVATSPFTTGLGNGHPLENGFAFLNPYGLPYLPGSGVKGVLRQAVRELASGQWDDRRGWSEERRYTVQIEKETIQLSMLDVLFGRETGDGETGHVRGVLSFWDVIPQIKGDSLMVEIMTPHQGHYYQWEKDQNGNEIQVPPHDSGSPIPISFLTVPPGSGFTFHVVCDLIRLNQLAPELAQDSHWKTLLTAAFEHAFQWLGFGAKTVVGYGAMESSAMREARLKAEKERREREAEEAKRIQEARQQAEAVAWEGARLKFNRASKALIAEKGGKSAVALAPKGEELLASLPPDVRKKVEINQFVKVTAYVAGSNLVRVEA
ncbi:MAG: type III-B CRISPR module RAMP protein Cmr6 [Gammaproteobacteria bacterium]